LKDWIEVHIFLMLNFHLPHHLVPQIRQSSSSNKVSVQIIDIEMRAIAIVTVAVVVVIVTIAIAYSCIEMTHQVAIVEI